MIARLAPFFLSRKGGKATRFNFSCFIFGHYFEERERKNRFFFERKKKRKKKPSRFFFFFFASRSSRGSQKTFRFVFFFLFFFFPLLHSIPSKITTICIWPLWPPPIIEKEEENGANGV